MVRKFALVRIVVIDLVEKVGIEVGPFLEGKLLTEQARSHVTGYQCSLDEQRATATHGVDEVRLATPTGHQDHTCGQHFVQRCLYRLLAIAATMQALATRVQT